MYLFFQVRLNSQEFMYQYVYELKYYNMINKYVNTHELKKIQKYLSIEIYTYSLIIRRIYNLSRIYNSLTYVTQFSCTHVPLKPVQIPEF